MEPKRTIQMALTKGDAITYAALIATAIVEAFDPLRKDLAVDHPLFANSFWAYLPFILLLLLGLVMLWQGSKRGSLKAQSEPSFDTIHLTQVVNETFKNQTVSLDGYEYVNCTFENVTFRYE
jgi:hypothetical protein